MYGASVALDIARGNVSEVSAGVSYFLLLFYSSDISCQPVISWTGWIRFARSRKRSILLALERSACFASQFDSSPTPPPSSPPTTPSVNELLRTSAPDVGGGDVRGASGRASSTSSDPNACTPMEYAKIISSNIGPGVSARLFSISHATSESKGQGASRVHSRAVFTILTGVSPGTAKPACSRRDFASSDMGEIARACATKAMRMGFRASAGKIAAEI